MIKPKFERFGLALGGGGVKGLAHIALLKLLDEYDIKPTLIAGTSMGAILGALYASGLSGKDIEDRVLDHAIPTGEKAKVWYERRHKLLTWAKLFRFDGKRGGLINAEGLFEHLFNELMDIQFSDLEIPFIATAVNLRNGEPVVMDDGDLLSAVRASMAVPGVFAPVERDGLLLIDGGILNNLPCNQIQQCELRIASDTISLSEREAPSTTEVIAGAVTIMLRENQRQQLEAYPVDLLFDADTRGIDAFDFLKIKETMKRGDEAAATFREKLEKYLESLA